MILRNQGGKMKRRGLMVVVVCMLVLPSIGWAATLLRGTVLEDQSGLVIDASVLVYKKNPTGGWNFAGSRETDETGKYSFTYLEPGTYYLEFMAFIDCDRLVNYCADKYLPQIYKNIAPWDFNNKTEIILQEGDVKELDTTRIKTRPFYFDTTPKVVNNTGNPEWMLFWGVADSPYRTDHSVYYGMQASYSLGQGQWKQLKPGINTVTFTFKLPQKALIGRYDYWMIGGDSNLLPMTPYLEGSFCNGVSEDKEIAD
jgi:hypothetical protein